MSYSIALAGKGGTGKTTVAGFLIRYLVSEGRTPVLAVDADANSNLNEVLGLEISETLGDAREEMKKGVSSGMTKDVFMEMKLQEAVIESSGFDLIVMGRPEGAGCYCAANSLLTMYLEKLIKNYEMVVTDNEAGMEHISRLTTDNIDDLIVVSDSSIRGIQAAARIVELTEELKLNIIRKSLIVNRVKDGERARIEEAVKKYNLELMGIIPEDPVVFDYDLEGKPTSQLGEKSTAVVAANSIFRGILGR